MRPLRKLPTPPFLEERGLQLRDHYMQSLTEGGVQPTPWNHPEIRDRLREETNSRCAYCEGEILAVSYPHIEHYRPKALFPELVVDWNNLTIACPRCNTNKSDKWDDNVPFVNPFRDEVHEHIVFIGPLAWGISTRGDYTITQIKLNDLAVVEERDKQIKTLMSLIKIWRRSEGALRDVYHAEIREFIDDCPYFAAISAAMKSAGLTFEGA